jgi:DNA mismatch repair protein MutS
MTEEITPLMKQYFKIKSQYPEEIVFFRMGDFYEMFGDDAKTASDILGIALTSRGHIQGEKIPLAGVPYHAAEKYLSQLLKAGKKVVVCEQMEDPRLAKGIVDRDVVEIITPGTVTIDGVVEATQNNYLAGLSGEGEKLGLSVLDITTGEFKLDQGSRPEILERLSVVHPAEILIPAGWSQENISQLRSLLGQWTVTTLEIWKFDFDFAYQVLTQQLGVKSLEGFGCQEMPLGISAAGAVLAYLKQTKKPLLSHISKVSPFFDGRTMFLDFNTIRNLELILPLREGQKGGTLFDLLNRTKTPMGARLLRHWITNPLLKLEEITDRLDALEELRANKSMSDALAETIKGISDLERLAGKLGYGKITPRDLIWLKNSLEQTPEMGRILENARSQLLKSISQTLPDTREVADLIQNSIVDDPPLTLTEGGIIRSGFSLELDGLKGDIKGSKSWIAGLQQKERDRTKIPSLKVGFNKVFGYYIEVTKPHLSKVPADYIRKQTMVNAERFVTPELKEKEEYILGAEEKIFKLEHDLFLDIRSRVAKHTREIQKTAGLVALVDVCLSLKEVALRHNYVRPEVDLSGCISIQEGRHPVIETILQPGSFVPNDTEMDPQSEQIHVITGPNMAGKSTYLRQVGLIVLLAQMGSFVPAKAARIGLVDRIFTRVGAADYLTLGQSTFLVEMMETANILNNATPKSLILLDEVGRGTSTFDGLSIAWSVAEHIHDSPKIGAKALFATHYHELTELARFLPRVKNYQVAVKQWEDEIVFLRKIVPGGCDDSYGIHVARLAGIPSPVLSRAKKILADLESGEASSVSPSMTSASPPVGYQLSIFSPGDDSIARELKGLNVDQLTPLEALNKLHELKKKADES